MPYGTIRRGGAGVKGPSDMTALTWTTWRGASDMVPLKRGSWCQSPHWQHWLDGGILLGSRYHRVPITEGEFVTKPLPWAQVRWCILLGSQCHMVDRASTTGWTEEGAGTKVPTIGRDLMTCFCFCNEPVLRGNNNRGRVCDKAPTEGTD